MIAKILGWAMVAMFFGILVWGIVLGYQNDVEKTAYRETLPSMEPAGEFHLNHTTVSLWTFDFEDKKCLWGLGIGKTAGLTCW